MEAEYFWYFEASYIGLMVAIAGLLIAVIGLICTENAQNKTIKLLVESQGLMQEEIDELKRTDLIRFDTAPQTGVIEATYRAGDWDGM